MKTWRTNGGTEFLIINARRPHVSKWGTLAQSQVLPVAPTLWADSPVRTALGFVLVGALVGWLISIF
jgi:hypothetical protein